MPFCIDVTYHIIQSLTHKEKAVKLLSYALALATTACIAGNAIAADKFVIDKNHSSIGFSVKHLMVSTVKGHFGDFTGEIMLDATDMTKSSVTVTIQTASISTGVEGRDNHLKSLDFFDVAKNPAITFTSSRVEKKGDGYVAYGMFMMSGVSKEIALPFSLTGPLARQGGKILGADASLTINRQDYGVKWSRAMDGGGFVVSDEVKIELNVEAGTPKM